MAFEFYKYQGTGNDFVMIDNRQRIFSKNNTKLVAQLCDRRFGVGADGLILLEPHATADFSMVYYNADGNLSSMCGNGGRCIVHFANYLGIIDSKATFEAVDGMHEATIEGELVSLRMNDVHGVTLSQDFVFLDTGSPHHVEIVEAVDAYNVFEKGRAIRNDRYGKAGANINFVTPKGNDIFSVRTYERGVEDETLSCGTGVTAVALAMHVLDRTRALRVTLETPGGNLTVTFTKTDAGYKDVYLIGPAVQVFKGTWS
ncbi:diaminopimelate epimerase [uncultured Altibacter sp.]|uniref:diaminopimelate epimerase n=1 Tax=uncultured Altibacter sp. TaxID=2506933 RepID=UPI0030D8AAF8